MGLMFRTFHRDWDLHIVRASGLTLAYVAAQAALHGWRAMEAAPIIGQSYDFVGAMTGVFLSGGWILALVTGYLASTIATVFADRPGNVFPFTAMAFLAVFPVQHMWVAGHPGWAVLASLLAMFVVLIGAVHMMVARYRYLAA